MTIDYSKAPRLYIDAPLSQGGDIDLPKDHIHYLINVMRKDDGEMVRIFNGKDGEFVGKLAIQNKKSASLKWLERIREQEVSTKKITLYCPPIKKDRFAFMIEKAVELGVTHIQPIVTERTQNAKINLEKCERYIIEAVEQCERLDLPTIQKPILIDHCNFVSPSYAGIERDGNAPLFSPEATDSIGLIIGPEGGWTVKEIEFLKNHSSIHTVSLGKNILRAETAAIFMLSRI